MKKDAKTGDKRVLEEQKRLKKLLDRAEVPAQQREVLDAVIENMAWQRIKLDDTREEIKNSGVVVPYDNGGGQKGVRENPLYKGYVNLWRAYMVGLEKYTSYLPKELQEEASGSGISVLEQVKQMKAAT